MTQSPGDLAYGLDIELEGCSLVYGQAPCTAFGDPGFECLNTFRTCQDRENYAPTPRNYSLIASTAYRVPVNTVPCLSAPATITPTSIKEGEGLAIRGALSLKAVDFPYDDSLPGDDPYKANRPGGVVGNFFGKLLARFPWYAEREARYKTGYWTDAGPVWTKTYLYALDRIDLGRDGNVTIRCQDFLFYVNDETKKIPQPSNAKLTKNIGAGGPHDVQFDAEFLPYFQAEPLPGVVRIGDELIHYETVNDVQNELEDTTRGWQGSINADHDPGDPLRRVYHVDNENVVDVLADLFHVWGGVPKEFIPYDEYQDVPTGTPDLWDQEKGNWLASVNVTNAVSDPQGLQSIIDEICVQTGIIIWWDPERERLGLNASILQLGDDQQPTLTDSMMLADTLRISNLRQAVLSRAWWWYDQINVTEGTKAENFAQLLVIVDTDLESDSALGRPSTLDVFGDWFAQGQGANVSAIARRKLLQRSVPRLQLRFSALPEALDADLFPGSFFILESFGLQDATGNIRRTRCQVSQLAPTLDGQLEILALTQEIAIPAGARYGRIGPDSLLDYDNDSPANRDLYAWVILDGDPFFSDGGHPYWIL